MTEPNRSIQIDHDPVIYAIETASEDAPLRLTLLELVHAISEVSLSEQELLATLIYVLRSGRVRLKGNFRSMPIDQFCD